jgi:hypothetical protein
MLCLRDTFPSHKLAFRQISNLQSLCLSERFTFHITFLMCYDRFQFLFAVEKGRNTISVLLTNIVTVIALCFYSVRSGPESQTKIIRNFFHNIEVVCMRRWLSIRDKLCDVKSNISYPTGHCFSEP